MVLHIIVPFKFKCSFKHAQKDYPSPSNDLFQVLDLTVYVVHQGADFVKKLYKLIKA